MILSNTAIQEALDSGDIVIHPEPCRKPNINQAESPFATSAVDLRLSDALSIPRKGKPFNFDLRLGGLAPFLAEVCEPVRIDSSGGYALQPIRLSLATPSSMWTCPFGLNAPPMRRALRVKARAPAVACWFILRRQRSMLGFRVRLRSKSSIWARIPLLCIPVCRFVS